MRLFHKKQSEREFKEHFPSVLLPPPARSDPSHFGLHAPAKGTAPPLLFQFERVGRGEENMELFQSSMTYAETVSIPRPVNQFGDVWLIPH